MKINSHSHSHSLRVAALSFSTSILLSVVQVSSANAQQVAEDTNWESEVAQIADEQSNLKVDSSGAVAVGATGGAITLRVGVDGPVSQSNLGNSMEIGISYADEVAFQNEGTYSLKTDNSDVFALVQPLTNGVRVLSQINSPSGVGDLHYSFDVPSNTTLLDIDGGYLIVDSENVYGMLHDPWAVDASGKELPTSYTWEQGMLTQNIDTSTGDVSYPITADPAWTYTYSYNMYKTASQVKTLLAGCFNCYFPVDGAPKAFPTVGQILPLTVIGLPFECKFAGSQTSTNYFSFSFNATRNHIDGYGSKIKFDFVMVGYTKKLVVTASIENQLMNNIGYKTGASNEWATFAANLNRA